MLENIVEDIKRVSQELRLLPRKHTESGPN
jgi:hypothetical protein